MLDVTFFELDIDDSFDFHPTTTVGTDALPAAESEERADDAASAGEADASADGTGASAGSSGGTVRTLLAAVAVAVVATVVALAVARLLSNDDLSDLADLDERGSPAGDGSRTHPA